MILSSSINELDTEGDIWEMGTKLANEVSKYLNEKILYKFPFKLSFIGHSMGGILVRIAIN